MTTAQLLVVLGPLSQVPSSEEVLTASTKAGVAVGSGPDTNPSLQVNVGEGSHPERVKVYGPGVEKTGLKAQEPTYFTVDCSEAGQGGFRAHTHSHAYTHFHIHVCTFTHVQHMLTYIHSHMILKYICKHMCSHICLHTCTHTPKIIRVHTCAHMYLCFHTMCMHILNTPMQYSHIQ